MKSYYDRLVETDEDQLRLLISRQEGELDIVLKDLGLMKRALSEKTAKKETENYNEPQNR